MTTTTTKPALAVGQRWLTVAGYEAYIIKSEPCQPNPGNNFTKNCWHVKLLAPPRIIPWAYYDDGTARGLHDAYTLTTLLPKLEVGQRWRTRDGKVVTVTHYNPTDKSHWPYTCSNNISYRSDGFQLGWTIHNNYDLVEYLDGVTEFTNATTSQAPRFLRVVELPHGGVYAIAEDSSLWQISGTCATRVDTCR